MADGGNPKRREHHAADAGAVIGHRQRGGPRPDEPRRDDGVDGGSAHRHPSRAAEKGRRKQLPRLDRNRPTQNANGQRNRAGLRDSRKPVAKIEFRQPRDDERAEQEVGGDRCRHQRQRPAPEIANRLQIDRRTVEPETPAEYGQHESRGDNAPSMEFLGNRQCRHRLFVSPLRAPPQYRHGAQGCYGEDRSIPGAWRVMICRQRRRQRDGQHSSLCRSRGDGG